MIAGPNVVQVCHACETAHVYDDREQWIESERENYQRFLDCDHEFNLGDPRAPRGQCAYCGLPEGTDPADVISDEVDISDLKPDTGDDDNSGNQQRGR
jgi:hypothetical protein